MTPYYDQGGIVIYQGDCREVMPTLAPKSVTLLWTDPPYGHENNAGDLNAHLAEKEGRVVEAIANDGADSMREVVDSMLKLAIPLLRRESAAACCCCGGGGPTPTFAWLAQRLDSDGFQFFHSVIWDKVMPGLGWRYRRQHEMVMVAHRKGGKLAWADPDQSTGNIIRMTKPRTGLHPNEKPTELVGTFIRLHTKPGELVLDPFMGSGTTLFAAKNLGRPAIGIELEERYCEVAAKRLQQETLFGMPEAAAPVEQGDMFGEATA